MSTVGFDDAQVRRLQYALHRALDDLDRLSRLGHQVDAGPAYRHAVDQARHVLLDHWLPTTRRVLSCDALSGSVWASGGWTVAVAGTGAGSVAPPTELAESGRQLAERWLDAQRRWQGGVDTAEETRAVRQQVASLARVVPIDRVDALLEQLPPVVGALLLPSLRLPDHHLARAALRLQQREAAALFDVDDPTISSWGTTQSNTSDLVTATLAARPSAAQRWATQAIRTPGVLFTAFDRSNEQRALAAATAPGTGDARAAGEIVATLLAQFVHHPFPTTAESPALPWGAFMASLSAPWFPELVTGTGRFTWPDHEVPHRRALQHLLWDDDAADLLAHAAHSTLVSTVHGGLLDRNGHVDLAIVDRLAEVTVTFADTQRQVHVDAAHIDRRNAELTTAAVEYVVTKGAAMIPVAGPAVAAATAPVAAAMRRWSTDQGWFPPPADQVERTTDQAVGDHLADVQTVVLVAAAADLIAAGRLPARFLDELPRGTDGCRAERTDRSLRDHVLRYARTHPAAAADLTAALGAFANRATTATVCP